MAPTDNKLTGSAGEQHVCSMLARYGWAASLTRDGLERTDVLAVHSATREMVEVQVKTVRSGNWMLGRKGTLPDRSGREWYVFVKLGAPPGLPECSVVPRDHVAAATWIGHRAGSPSPESRVGHRAVSLLDTVAGLMSLPAGTESPSASKTR